MHKLTELIKNAPRVVAFTGAGISTLCGIPDFRGPQGLYKQPDAERIFDIGWFHRDPAIYYRGCRELIYGLQHRQPGIVHRELARLEQVGILQGVITQNIDMLHQKAGSRTVFELHGSPLRHYCVGCRQEQSFEAICHMLQEVEVPRCAQCHQPYKPQVTFFGESLPASAFDGASALARTADLMLVLGSSLTVQPAASLPLLTLQGGGKLVIVNAQPTVLDQYASATYSDLEVFAGYLESF